MDPKAEKRKRRLAAKERRARLLVICLCGGCLLLAVALLVNALR